MTINQILVDGWWLMVGVFGSCFIVKCLPGLIAHRWPGITILGSKLPPQLDVVLAARVRWMVETLGFFRKLGQHHHTSEVSFEMMRHQPRLVHGQGAVPTKWSFLTGKPAILGAPFEKKRSLGGLTFEQQPSRINRASKWNLVTVTIQVSICRASKHPRMGIVVKNHPTWSYK